MELVRKPQSNSSIIIRFSFLSLLIAKLFGEFFPNISTVDIVIALLPIVLLLIQISFRLKANKLFISIMIWDFITIMYLIRNFNGYYLRVIIFQNLVLLYCLFSEQKQYTKKAIETAIRMGSMIVAAFSISGLAFFRLNNDIYYSICSYIIFEFSYFCFCRHKNKILTALILSALLLLFKSRSSIIMMITMLVFYYLLKWIKTKKQFVIIFIAVSVIVFLIPELYMKIYSSQNAEFLNLLAKQYTGKNLFSGRNIIWPVLDEWLNRDLKTWLFGLGGEFVGGSFFYDLVISDVVVSTHNLFLFLRGQGGMVFFCLFIFIVYNIYSQFYDFLDDEYICIGSAYLLALMIRASFDLLLMANRFVDSMFSWFVISLILGYVNYLKTRRVSEVR